MIWLAWRQFRAQALTGLALLAAAGIYFLVTGLQMHHTYAADLASCTPLNSCDDVLNQFQSNYDAMFHFTELFLLAAPALIGMFWGAPDRPRAGDRHPPIRVEPDHHPQPVARGQTHRRRPRLDRGRRGP